MRSLAMVCLVGCVFLQGCAGMIVRENDSIGTKTAKVTGRVLLAVPTFLMSEVGIATIKQEEERDAGYRQSQQARHDASADKQANLNRAVGKLTFDEAIQRWGQPVSVVDGREITAAVWQQTTVRAGRMILPDPVYWSPMYVDTPSHGEKLDCTFSKETGILKSIRYSAW